jgi:ribonuclease R
MAATGLSHHQRLKYIARRVLLEQGLLTDFPPEVERELKRIQQPGGADQDKLKWLDLRQAPWCSIDNNDSRDLDQLTVAESLPAGRVRLQVAIADVDSLVREGTSIDGHARHNTTSIYTPAEIFPMLPERLSTNLTSLNPHQDRKAIVIEMIVEPDGSIQASEIHPALVRNHAKLAYRSVAGWLDGQNGLPEAAAGVSGLEANLRLQDSTAQKMKQLRHSHGALSLETIESNPIFNGEQLVSLEVDEKNRARDLIENFMVAANGVTARFLSTRGFPTIRRVVRSPRRWDRILELARQTGASLPETPDSRALEAFLVFARENDPLHFPDLSLAVIKLLGNGEYLAEPPDGNPPGHFGLAVKDYSHSTAPNRRYPDLITQRLLKAALAEKAVPYSMEKLETLANHCTQMEDLVSKVERRVEKSAAALVLEHRIGEKFDAIVTGAAPKGTWVRLLPLPVEGKLTEGFAGVDVGDRICVRLLSLDVEAGHIDFRKC